jgi:peptidoglycan hydrolase-like protein with peptidoglycan-binding domain
VYVKKLRAGVDDSDSVKVLRRALIRRGFLDVSKPLSLDRPGNRYTPAVERAVKRWQKKHDHTVTGILTNHQAVEFFAPNKHVQVHPA